MDKLLALDLKMVEEFVGKAHSDLGRVVQLLDREQALINAAWDWGGGDWETALGAASHMGRKDIANYLIEKGARIDLFAAAMLGKLEIVKSVLMVYPQARNVPGPHGIPLIAHAEIGGDDAKVVFDFLRSFK
ncbi:MAG: ankyrin repeat domain-containing protein [Anaerolineales bacterium]|nr:ankyrin repeat domain-containing protein [Anaerolineales bacterium]